MANEGEYPKVDGDIFYGKDANIAYYGELNSATMNYGAVTVLTASVTTIKAANTNRKVILIRNNGSENVYIGGTSGVSTASAYTIPVGENIKLFTQATIYGITTTNTVDVRYLEVE